MTFPYWVSYFDLESVNHLCPYWCLMNKSFVEQIFFWPWNIKLWVPKELIRNFRIFYICAMCKITNMKTQIEDLSLRLKINVQIICQKLLNLEKSMWTKFFRESLFAQSFNLFIQSIGQDRYESLMLDICYRDKNHIEVLSAHFNSIF